MNKLIVILFITLFPGVAFSAVVKKSLSEAIKDKMVNVNAVNFTGMYQGKTTRLVITNNTKSVLQIKVDIGMVLKADDTAYQPMVLAGEEMLALMPKAGGELEVQTFCGNAPRSGPRKDLHYAFSHVAGDTLVKILQFIKTNALFDGLGQSAVWAITNNHDIGDVYDSRRDVLSKKFILLICATTGRPLPQYYSEVAVSQVPDAPAYVPKTLKIFAEFEIRLEAPKTMTLGIYDEAGTMVQKVFEDQQFGKSGHRFNVEFEAENALPGKYYIRLKEGGTVLQEKMVNVD